MHTAQLLSWQQGWQQSILILFERRKQETFRHHVSPASICRSLTSFFNQQRTSSFGEASLCLSRSGTHNPSSAETKSARRAKWESLIIRRRPRSHRHVVIFTSR